MRILTIITMVVCNMLGMHAQPQFGTKHGIFNRSYIRVTLTASSPSAKIYYTTDGTEPTTASKEYTAAVSLNKTTCLRAIEVNGSTVSAPATQTYIFESSLLSQEGAPEGYPTTWGNYTQIYGTAIADYDMDPSMTTNATLRPKILEGLHSLPILSIVTDKDNLFSHERDSVKGGIYIFTGTPVGDNIGNGWERPASIELFGGPQNHDLSINCALRLHGGHGRLAEKNPKHSFRVKFKKDYGPSKLEYPVFGENEPQEFNSLVFRCHFGNSWQHWSTSNHTKAQYARDVWMRRMQKKMSGICSDALYVHLFLNGMYWGLYNIAERLDDNYGKQHFGGKKSDYDIIKIEEEGGNHVEASEGTLDKWNRMKRVVRMAGDDKYYYQLEGKDENGVPNDTIEKLLDIDNFIDYMILNQFGGNNDWDHHNWFAVAANGSKPMPFKFVCWDTELIFESLWDNKLDLVNHGMPTEFFHCLVQNPKFISRYTRRAHELLTGDGLLTPTNVIAVWDSIYNVIHMPLYMEAARWGDYRYAVHPYTSKGKRYTVDEHYMTERNRLLNDYFPNRTRVFLDQIKKAGWYDETGIRDVCVSQDNVSERIHDNSLYDLQGRRVAKPGKGIYIMNGKKILIK